MWLKRVCHHQGSWGRRVYQAGVYAYRRKIDSIIRSALEKNLVVLNGPLELTGVNVYNARCLHGFITSTYFVMVRDGKEDRMLHSSFVIKMQDEKIVAAVYRWE